MTDNSRVRRSAPIAYETSRLDAGNCDLVLRRLLDAFGVVGILLIVVLNVARARTRARMTPEERAEHDEDVRRFEQEW
jgi:hypothetical protein